jgi:hypothetical protein
MRITHDMLMKVASDAVARQARQDRDLLSAYLCGSLLGEDYLLGGTADVDLVFVYNEPHPIDREVRRLTDDVHLDIAHHSQKDYRELRRLRVHPWLGPVLTTCKILFDPQHFLDFTQASVRGQFDRPDHVFERSSSQAEKARRIWWDHQLPIPDPQPDDVTAYLKAVAHAANAIASLTGPPLTERRFLLHFPGRAAALDRPGLYAGLLGLIGAPNLEVQSLRDWLPAWRQAYQALPSASAPARLHLDRLPYYQRALVALLDGDQPLAALWPLLRTWTLAASLYPPESAPRQHWQAAFESLGLAGAAFAGKFEALDAYLDVVDETLETWARANGAWEG